MFPILTAISVISLGQGVADVNVALNKPVYYCKDVRKYMSMTDGSVYFRNAEIISGECESGSYVRVDLLEQYFVHYVVVFEGPSMQSDLNQAALDYFLVEFVGIDGKVTMCSAFAKKSIGPQEGKGMRVNCIRALASIVMIKSRQTKGISIAELEVYTMASGVPKETAVHYQGCYAEFSHLVFHPIEASRDCLQKCAQGQDKYGAVRKNTCYCGPAFNDQKKVADAECSNKCTKTNCDAPDLYTVYLVQVQLPVYFGCLKRNVSGVTIKGTMTIYRCVFHCGSLGYIQANLMKGNECECSSTENEKHFENIVHCDIPCTGNKEQFCGGNGYTSTYQLGLLMFETKLFTDLDCFKDAPEIYCNSSCRAGYTGEHCLTSDHKLTTRKSRPTTASESTSTKISTNRSTAQRAPVIQNKFSTATIHDPNCEDKNNGVGGCVCKDGFVKSPNNITCVDRNECNFHVCDLRVSTCVNNEGSYECQCIFGYEMIMSSCVPAIFEKEEIISSGVDSKTFAAVVQYKLLAIFVPILVLLV